MTPLVRSFKRVAAQVAQRMNFKMSVFNHERGLGDFLLDHELSNDPIGLTAQAILQFCVDEGGYNGFAVGVMVCVAFLEEVMPAPPTGDARARALKDLFVLLKSPPELEAVKRWVESYYR
jgi:hypothetical protein